MSTLRELLLEVRSQHGQLTPASVVESARPDDAPLHDRFEWDDAVAGEKFRLVQAHELIQSVRIRYVSGDRSKTIRGLVAVARPDSPQPVYEPAEEALQDPLRKKLILQQMERDWRSLRARYEDVAEFAELVLRDMGDAA